MLIALDTATEWCTAGLSSTDLKNMLTVSRRVGTGHSAYLLPMLDGLIQQRATTMSAITGIVVTVGPGSFTGLRIACGVAHGLALSQNLPVVPLSTLEVIAQRFKGHAVPTVVCLDARMDELYCGVFDADGVRLMDDFVAKPGDVNARVLSLLNSSWFNAVGNGWALAATQNTAMFKLVDRCEKDAYPLAADMLNLGAKQLRLRSGYANDGVRNARWSAEDALPVYIRNNVALDMAAQRQLRFANDQIKLQELGVQTIKGMVP